MKNIPAKLKALFCALAVTVVPVVTFTLFDNWFKTLPLETRMSVISQMWKCLMYLPFVFIFLGIYLHFYTKFTKKKP